MSKKPINENGFINRPNRNIHVNMIAWLVLFAVVALISYASHSGRLGKKEQPGALKQVKNDSVLRTDTLTALITPYHANFYECHSDKNITANGDYGHVGGCACSIPMFINHVDMGDSVIVCDGVLKGRYIINDISGSKLMHVDIYRNIGDKTACCYRSKIKIIKEWNKNKNFKP
jgi:hypothetical protein